MSGRYIDAELMKKNHLMSNDCNNCEQDPIACKYDYDYTKMDFCLWIDNEPTADVRENIRGEWKAIDRASGVWACSICGWSVILHSGTPSDQHCNFCTNCGAEMREEERDVCNLSN